MPFNNIKEEPTETDRRGLIVLIMLPLFLVGFFAFNHLAPGLGFQERNGQLHHTIGFDEVRDIRIGKLCAELPKPEKFEFISSTDNSSFDYSMDIYHYRSIRGAAEIMPTFLVWFNENGWYRIPDTSTFEKGKQKIYISANFDFQFTNYDIYCSEKD